MLKWCKANESQEADNDNAMANMLRIISFINFAAYLLPHLCVIFLPLLLHRKEASVQLMSLARQVS